MGRETKEYAAYDMGQEHGWIAGHKEGYKAGYARCQQDSKAFDIGKQDAYAKGHKAGVEAEREQRGMDSISSKKPSAPGCPN
jgi:flagellar biosynthesis/type III secretory pathway protein FliH